MKLTVENFISIKKAELELNNITLIIGEQAEGKSLLAKLVYYFMMIIETPFPGYKEYKDFSDCIEEYKREFQRRFFYQENDDYSIKFEINEDLWYSIIYNPIDGFKIDIAEKITDFILKHIELRKKPGKESSEEILRYNIGYDLDIQHFYDSINYKKALFIYSARSFYGILERIWLPLINENIEFADPFLFEYGDLLQKAKDVSSKEKFRNWDDDNKKAKEKYKGILELLGKKIIKGEYNNINGQEFIISENNRKTLVTHCSSGQKESLSIVLILQALISNDIYDYMDYKEIIIEEPESHVFPSTQKDIVNLICFIYNQKKPYINFLITTHSPYILTAFNNLILGGDIYPKAGQDKIEKIIHPEFLLKKEPESPVTAYHLKNGVLEKIMDSETGLILAEGIDKVSEDIGEQFNQLLDLE
jgi:hypothetical protein